MKILVVDDEKKIADALAERLRLRSFEAEPVYDGTSALSSLRTDSFDGVILDLRLPDIDGIDILRQTKAAKPEIRVVILSGHGNEQDFKTCLGLGAVACFQKPANIQKLIEALVES
ncbi:MAG: response regulator [Deltaproteobacteria bacterium]|nr:response regulator [Deltaproteobacteria bacterium]